MNVLELFSGTANLTRNAKALGHNAFSIDLNEPADLNADILTLTAADIKRATGFSHIDMLWASPPCQGFSVASIGTMWESAGVPKHETSRQGMLLLEHTLRLIQELDPTVWYIENPRGMMRKLPVMEPLKMHTVTFCQYGEDRMKPTDIWTNSKTWQPRPMCKPGASCHVPAPRGSQAGTQGMKNPLDKGRIPDELCHEVIEAAKRG